MTQSRIRKGDKINQKRNSNKSDKKIYGLENQSGAGSQCRWEEIEIRRNLSSSY